ncbi:MAG TPA: flagellar basal-body MS-ring/collar protein FliF [Longimicrobiaceae bacterium]|nr:flagellar basal-body MS-ring/collar protein FliF [Longimicrobiaceae bacterium]
MPIAFPPVVEEWMERLGGRHRVMIAGVGVATVVLILAVSRWASAPTYVPAFSDLKLETVGKITAKLDESGVPYRLADGGTAVEVPSDQLAHVRVLLAGDGLPAQGRPGMELFDQPSWGMTDFTQRVNYRRALEGELERTIGQMTGVRSAQVHLAIDETRGFRVSNDPKAASVVLALQDGSDPGQDVVRGIQHLVASSVGGLHSDEVAVLDDSGRMLSDATDPGSIEGMTTQQLGVQREVEGYLEKKAQSLVSEVVGPGNARVKVAADINFDKVERTVQKVDPDAQALTTEQKSEIIPGAQGGAGSKTTAETYQNSTSMESFTGATGDVKRLTVAVVVDEKRVPKGDTAVFVPRSAAELAQIETLVRSAIGIDPTRGDVVSVVSMRFHAPPPPPPEPAPSVLTVVHDYSSQIVAIVGLLLAAFVAMRVLRALKNAPARAPTPALAAAGAPSALPASEHDQETEAMLERLLPKKTLSTANQRMRTEVVTSVEESPDTAAKLVRAWLKEV